MTFVKCQRCKSEFYRAADQTWKRLCLDCWRKTRDEPLDYRCKRKSATVPGLDALMLRRLLQLCHPDRHGGSEAATTATQFLLELRRKIV